MQAATFRDLCRRDKLRVRELVSSLAKADLEILEVKQTWENERCRYRQTILQLNQQLLQLEKEYSQAKEAAHNWVPLPAFSTQDAHSANLSDVEAVHCMEKNSSPQATDRHGHCMYDLATSLNTSAVSVETLVKEQDILEELFFNCNSESWYNGVLF